MRADDVPLDTITDLGQSVVAVVGEKRSTWRCWNLHSEASRQLMGVRFASSEDREAITGLVTDAAEQASLRLTPPELSSSPLLSPPGRVEAASATPARSCTRPKSCSRRKTGSLTARTRRPGRPWNWPPSRRSPAGPMRRAAGWGRIRLTPSSGSLCRAGWWTCWSGRPVPGIPHVGFDATAHALDCRRLCPGWRSRPLVVTTHPRYTYCEYFDCFDWKGWGDE